jgi:hypothetical protein
MILSLSIQERHSAVTYRKNEFGDYCSLNYFNGTH